LNEQAFFLLYEVAGFVGVMYLCISYVLFVLTAWIWIPFFLVQSVILYFWVYFPIVTVMEVPVWLLEKMVLKLKRKGSYYEVQTDEDSIDNERMRTILMKHQSLTHSFSSDDEIKHWYHSLARTCHATGAPVWK